MAEADLFGGCRGIKDSHDALLHAYLPFHALGCVAGNREEYLSCRVIIHSAFQLRFELDACSSTTFLSIAIHRSLVEFG